MKTDKKIKLSQKLFEAERRIFELQTQLAGTLSQAFDNLPKAADFHASGVIVTLTAIGGKEVTKPFMIRDGLSQDSIRALQTDVCRSFELATLTNPAMATFYNKVR